MEIKKFKKQCLKAFNHIEEKKSKRILKKKVGQGLYYFKTDTTLIKNKFPKLRGKISKRPSALDKRMKKLSKDCAKLYKEFKYTLAEQNFNFLKEKNLL